MESALIIIAVLGIYLLFQWYRGRFKGQPRRLALVQIIFVLTVIGFLLLDAYHNFQKQKIMMILLFALICADRFFFLLRPSGKKN